MFKDRIEAGKRLALKFKGRELKKPLVAGIPRGGVITAAALAEEIGAELDVVLAKKLRAPFQAELGIGAVGENGEIIINEGARRAFGISNDYYQQEAARQMRELEERRLLYRKVRRRAEIFDRSVIVVDDGIATGSTVKAAVEVIRGQAPREIIVAVPVAAEESLEKVAQAADDVVCLHTDPQFFAVGQFYEKFEQTSDIEVVETLKRFRHGGWSEGEEARGV